MIVSIGRWSDEFSWLCATWQLVVRCVISEDVKIRSTVDSDFWSFLASVFLLLGVPQDYGVVVLKLGIRNPIIKKPIIKKLIIEKYKLITIVSPLFIIEILALLILYKGMIVVS